MISGTPPARKSRDSWRDALDHSAKHLQLRGTCRFTVDPIIYRRPRQTRCMSDGWDVEQEIRGTANGCVHGHRIAKHSRPKGCPSS